MGRWVKPTERVGFDAWKPTHCACGEPHPAFSRDGMAGPWRCRSCDATATRRPAADVAQTPPTRLL